MSSVWNCYRKCRLQLLNLVNTCSQRVHELDSDDSSFLDIQTYIMKESQRLAEDIAASIPFHLTRNPETFLAHPRQNSSSIADIPIPNNSIGGLLIMYAIYVVSKLPVVPLHLRDMFRQHLAWIGRVMGIGQASLLADVSVHMDLPQQTKEYLYTKKSLC